MHQERVALYQKVYGITEQEAEFRLSENHITEFRQLHKYVKEKSGFASFMVKHIPLYKVEAYFKEQAIQKLASCTSNSLFKAFDTGFSHADLEAAFNDAKAKLKSENLTAWGHIIPYGSDHRGYSELETSEYSNGGYVYFVVGKDDLAKVSSALSPVKAIHPRLIIVEAQPFDEVPVQPN